MYVCIKYLYMLYFLILCNYHSCIHERIWYIYIYIICIPPSSTSRVQAKMLPKRGRWQPQADRQNPTDWLQGLQGSVPGRGCTRECLKNLEDVRKIILDICSTLFDTFRVDLQSNLTWALITWSRVLMWIVVERHCFLSFRLASELESCCLMLFALDKVSGELPAEAWSMWQHHWDLPFLSLELQVKRGLYDELPQKTRHIIESCWETQVGGKAMPAVHVHRLRGTLCICNHAGEISKHIPRLFPKQGNLS